ncbi:C-24(28) sterol reductase [Onygenales sp. PD_40]|nr:C-24(28) sterol reductase [Onygenales sp. PD_40]KAK2800054.1 C-24(28) sterol reductase [Onygenales sp. PD_10]
MSGVEASARSAGQSELQQRKSAHKNRVANGVKQEPTQATTGSNHKIDEEPQFEFGGALGATAIMAGSPILMYYLYLGAMFYDGQFPKPAEGQSFSAFLAHLVDLICTHAFPHRKAWTIYWTLMVFEGAGYMLLPGIYGKGKRLQHLGGKQLDYYCSAIWAWYVTIAVAVGLHVSGLFKLYTLIDEFGPIMSVAIISGILCSFIAYFSALARGAQHRMTGSFLYDFFMGAELNPRLFGLLDIKMFFEVRIPWYFLFLFTLGAAFRQYEELGYVSGEVGFVLMAHFLYANACAKAEELIITSWDMYYEKLGFMLTFWNMAGVPMTYCHCTIYLAKNDPSKYHWNPWVLRALTVAYLFVYWVWDTSNSQKNCFRSQEDGTLVDRKTFPQLPWKYVKNPEVIRTDAGYSILCSGWFGMARKIHYSCDIFFALSWGFVTGFDSPFPWFYPVFFIGMITHRARRDIHRCRQRYGAAWEEYERRVPYLLIPYVI